MKLDAHHKPEKSLGMALAKTGVGVAVAGSVGYIAVNIFTAIVPPPVKMGAKLIWFTGIVASSWMAGCLAADFAEDSLEITKEVALELKAAFAGFKAAHQPPIEGEGEVATEEPNDTDPEEPAEN